MPSSMAGEGDLYCDGSRLDGRWCPRAGFAVIQSDRGEFKRALFGPISGVHPQTIGCAEHHGPHHAAPRVLGKARLVVDNLRIQSYH